MKNIGFDVDGVLSDFVPPYRKLIVDVTGHDLFPADFDSANPATWHFEKALGYTNRELDKVWAAIRASNVFWSQAKALPGMDALRAAYLDGGLRKENLYFITARPGITAKAQTEIWLQNQGIRLPTVLMAADKGTAARLLDLDAYIDDKLENYWDVRQARTENDVERGVNVLLDYAHNQSDTMTERRVKSVAEFLDLLRS